MGIITISRQIGAGETTIAPAVAEKLGWECVDKQILNREVEETGITLPYLVHFDERMPGKGETIPFSHDAEKYFHALKEIIQGYARKGNVVLVGRGANFILKDDDALHYRLIADLPYRIRRVMEVRWVNEGPAREIIEQSDRDRAGFVRHYFQADWDDPLHYHALLNTSRLGIETVIERIVTAAQSRWCIPDNAAYRG
jgi:cytidylate kinase